MENPEQNKPQAAMVITIQSWATPVLALVMLVAGLLGGYFGRPLLERASTGSAAVTPTQVVAASPTQVVPTTNPDLPQSQDELMSFLIGQMRHFRGDPEAPVTLIEFSDFQ